MINRIPILNVINYEEIVFKKSYNVKRDNKKIKIFIIFI